MVKSRDLKPDARLNQQRLLFEELQKDVVEEKWDEIRDVTAKPGVAMTSDFDIAIRI